MTDDTAAPDLSEVVAMAIGLHQRDHLDEAQELYLRVLEIAPDHADALHFLGVLRHQQGDSESASQLIREALRIDPEYLGARINLGNVLRTCRGECCRQGGDHAFITVETILRYMADHPRQRPRHVLDAYLSQLAKKNYEQSCLYHADGGCTLSRDMRSQTCNEYLCDGVDDVLTRWTRSPGEPVFVAAAAGQIVVRAAIIDSHGREHTEDPGVETADPAPSRCENPPRQSDAPFRTIASRPDPYQSRSEE